MDYPLDAETIMKLSILIVNYNGASYLGNCLRSIEQQVHLDHEVIVVDNASTDGSCDLVKAGFPNVQLITGGKNLGFAGGNNLAAGEARGDYLLLLNPDTILLTDVNSAIEMMERQHNVGILGAKMVSGGGEYRFSSGHFPSPLRHLRFSSMYKKNGFFKHGNFPSGTGQGHAVDWVEGSFLLTRRSLWRKLGGMDEGYFMYGEDLDYCRRVYDLGFLTHYFPGIRYVHYGGFIPSRLPMLLSGFKRYHHKFSTLSQQILVSWIIVSGLIARIILHGILLLITRKPDHRMKVKASVTGLLAVIDFKYCSEEKSSSS